MWERILLAFPLTTRITGPVPFGPVQSLFEVVVLAAGRHRGWLRTTPNWSAHARDRCPFKGAERAFYDPKLKTSSAR